DANINQKKIDNNTGKTMNQEEDVARVEGTVEKESPRKKSAILRLFFVFVGGAIAVDLGELTPIHYSLWSLAIGIGGLKVGLIESKALEKSNSFTFVMVGILFVVIGTMAGVTPMQVLNNLPSIIAILIIGTAGIALG